MSSAAKKRSAMKSGGGVSHRDLSNERDATPIPNELSQDGGDNILNQQSSVEQTDRLEGAELDEEVLYAEYMLKPSNIRDIWSIFKVKKQMVDFMTWYFRPKNSYDPERVDYNALNILAEYQTYNLEFLKNELDCNFDQCANVLHALWNLLEFDPDEKSVQVEHGATDNAK